MPIDCHYVLLTASLLGAARQRHMTYVESEGSDIRYLDDKEIFAARDSAAWRCLTAIVLLSPTASVKFMDDVVRSFRRKTFKY
jgi:hypothetical protein